MSSAGKRPKPKVPKTFFFCDMKACPNCSNRVTGCCHTSNPMHALSLEGEFKQNMTDGSMWQVGVSVNGEIYDGKRPNRLTV